MTCSYYLSDDIVLLDQQKYVDKLYSGFKFYDENIAGATIKSELFHIVTPYDFKKPNIPSECGSEPKRKKRKAADFDEITAKIQNKHAQFLQLKDKTEEEDDSSNTIALEFVDEFNKHDSYTADATLKGANDSSFIVTTTFSDQSYLIPPHCRFFNDDVQNFGSLVGRDEKFDFIVLDPPWWNKYIRRTKAANRKLGYQMMDNESLKGIPLEHHIHDNTIVAIWCTNSPTHISAIKEQLCPKWNLKLVGSWYWMKVTKNGQPICSFNEATKKQPYERILIATSINSKLNIRPEMFIFSVPCAFHSNKPPLIELFADLLPEQPKCLEIFARNVYPNFTSIGTEVLKLQNARLFNLVKREVQ